jgi:hypothetical protein
VATYVKRKSNGRLYYGSTRLSEGDYDPGEAHLSLWQRRRVRDLYEAGELTAGEIAQMFNISDRSVVRIAREYGIGPKQVKLEWTPEQLKEAYDAYMDLHRPLSDAAKILGTCTRHVRQLLVRHFPMPARKPIPKAEKILKPKAPVGNKQRRLANEWFALRQRGHGWADIAAMYQLKETYLRRTYAYAKTRFPGDFVGDVDGRALRFKKNLSPTS